MKPNVEPLAYRHRKFLFIFLLVAFVLSFPIFMFYAAGYRYDFFSDKPTITATGGLYIAAEALDSRIFLNEVEVTNARVFRNASYIQGLEPGLNKIHVQASGLHTWVKNLSVYPHIVTEAESFNLPLVPQVRPITKYQTANGEEVFFAKATSTAILSFASSTVPFVVSTTTATSTYYLNSEYVLLNNLFVEMASSTASHLLTEEKFSFSTTSTAGQVKATTTVTRSNVKLYQNGDDVFAQVISMEKPLPHYFCSNRVELQQDVNVDTFTEVEDQDVLFENNLVELSNKKNECRTDIRIDRKSQKIHDFDFYPDNENLVLLNLDDGIYVVEIDDRSWQNMQLLYPGKNLTMFIYSGGIFIQDGSLIIEVLTEMGVQ